MKRTKFDLLFFVYSAGEMYVINNIIISCNRCSHRPVSDL